jgi:hypothetical protein
MPLTNVPSLYYPGKKGFKKYTFSYYASDNGNVNFTSVNLPYIDTIPNNLTIPDPASYTISKTTDTAVSIKYNTATPTYYEIATSIGAVQFIMTAPGDSTGLHPVSFYRALNSKLLGNLSYSSMQFTYVHFVADAQPDYQTYWAAHSQIYQAWKTPPSANVSYQRHF